MGISRLTLSGREIPHRKSLSKINIFHITSKEETRVDMIPYFQLVFWHNTLIVNDGGLQ